jgi:hypothetical protein
MARPVIARDVEAEAVEWLWRKRIPRGMITTIAGRPDQGKGLLGARITADVTQPVPVDEHSACKVNVLYSTVEDSYGIMTVPRLEAAGADLDRVMCWRFQLPSHFEHVKELVEANDIGLIIIDPFAPSLSHGITRFSDNVRDVLSPLSEFLEQTGTSVIIIEHALKRVSAAGHILDVIGGSSSGLVAASRAAYVFGIDPDDVDKRCLAVGKNNLRDKPEALSFDIDVVEIEGVGEIPALEFDKELAAFDPLRMFTKPPKGGAMGRPPEARAQAAEWLTLYLVEHGETKSTVIFEDAKQNGMNIKTLRRAADDMKIVKSAAGGPNVTWDLNDEIKDMLGILEPKEATESTESTDTSHGPYLENGDFYADPQAAEIELLASGMDDELGKLLAEADEDDKKDEEKGS